MGTGTEGQFEYEIGVILRVLMAITGGILVHGLTKPKN